MPVIYPTGLVNLVKAMLKKNPEKRPTIERILGDPFIKKHIALFLEKTKTKYVVVREELIASYRSVTIVVMYRSYHYCLFIIYLLFTYYLFIIYLFVIYYLFIYYLFFIYLLFVYYLFIIYLYSYYYYYYYYYY